ncbi:hypothetical protein BJ322DRAFT_1073586 [Thelephora terrestris]|uniref:F-box domain-containing protein n=1 Tax=Thelephora terrestris TaxID=56493 RepID=A0A9P6L4I5_9AGAM|nr:hypothetical protein BJ322DRAFT_1073586 [Thelephora terrestris]
MSPSTSANDEFLPAKGCTILSNEIGIGTIRSVEQQIKEHEMAIIRLKRVRNSLLNVSRLPPEILGDIFCRNVTFKGLFGGLGKGSHNFLLVCHHWFEVASCTPDLWSFWGNNLRDWTKLHLRYPTSPVDLVLDGSWNKSQTLHEACEMHFKIVPRGTPYAGFISGPEIRSFWRP